MSFQYEPCPAGLCGCCWLLREDGERREEPARYEWIFSTAYGIRLCVRCCAIWRETAVTDTCIRAFRIREIRERDTKALDSSR